jgi:hypothetical protein
MPAPRILIADGFKTYGPPDALTDTSKIMATLNYR